MVIEAKASPVFRTEQAKGLRAIADLPGLRRRILVYAGDATQRTSDGIDVWPLARLAHELHEGRL